MLDFPYLLRFLPFTSECALREEGESAGSQPREHGSRCEGKERGEWRREERLPRREERGGREERKEGQGKERKGGEERGGSEERKEGEGKERKAGK